MLKKRKIPHLQKISTSIDENFECSIKEAFRVQLLRENERRFNILIASTIACFTCPDILARIIAKTVKFTNCTMSENTYGIVKIAVLAYSGGTDTGNIKTDHNVTSAILSTGDIDLVHALVQSVKNNHLSKLEKIFFILPCQCQLDEVILKDWHFVEAPTDRFIRYCGGLTARRSGYLFRKDKFDSQGIPINVDDFLLPLSFILDPKDRELKIAAMKADTRNNSWRTFFHLMYNIDTALTNCNIDETTVLEVLRFWGAESNSFMLDEEFKTGSATFLASVVLNSNVNRIKIREDIYSGVFDFVKGIEKEKV